MVVDALYILVANGLKESFKKANEPENMEKVDRLIALNKEINAIHNELEAIMEKKRADHESKIQDKAFSEFIKGLHYRGI